MMIAGGLMVWILLVMAIVSIIIYFERFFDLRRAQIDGHDFLKGVINVLESGSDEEALSMCDEIQAPVANVVATAIRNRAAPARVLREVVDAQGRAEIGRLDRRLAALAIIAQIAPLIGLLGTIIGFIKAVMTMNSDFLVARVDLISAAIPALMAAAVGLAVAISVTVMYGSLRVRMDRIAVDLEASASQILGYISTQREIAR